MMLSAGMGVRPVSELILVRGVLRQQSLKPINEEAALQAGVSAVLAAVQIHQSITPHNNGEDNYLRPLFLVLLCWFYSGIRYVTQAQRHRGDDGEILRKRNEVYRAAQSAHPKCWSSGTRNWQPISTVTLNPEREKQAA